MANVLSIDVGGTRIKATVIPDQINLVTLQSINVEEIRSWGWLNCNLPQIVDPHCWASFTYDKFKLSTFDAIAIDGPWKVNANRVFGHYIDDLNIPCDLSSKLLEYTNKPVTNSLNDAVAWLKGMITYYKLNLEEIKFPVVAVILGTGTGLAYADSIQHIKGIELGEIDCPFTQIRKYVQFEYPCELHDALSKIGFSGLCRKILNVNNGRMIKSGMNTQKGL